MSFAFAGDPVLPVGDDSGSGPSIWRDIYGRGTLNMWRILVDILQRFDFDLQHLNKQFLIVYLHEKLDIPQSGRYHYLVFIFVFI